MLTVSNIERSIPFYRDPLGLRLVNTAVMEGKETDRLFNREHCIVKLAYLNGSEALAAPPMELIQFVGDDSEKAVPNLHQTSISEICFKVDDMDAVY